MILQKSSSRCGANVPKKNNPNFTRKHNEMDKKTLLCTKKTQFQSCQTLYNPGKCTPFLGVFFCAFWVCFGIFWLGVFLVHLALKRGGFWYKVRRMFLAFITFCFLVSMRY